MNDHLNDNNIPEDGLSAEELALLHDALAAAYPPPKQSLRAGVMAQVKRERAALRSRRLRTGFVKIGSLAACLALVTLVGIRVLPALTSKSADMAAYDTAEQNAELYTYTTSLADSDNGIATAPAEPEATQSAAANGTMSAFAAFSPAPEAEEAAEEAVTEAAEDYADAVFDESPAETMPETMAETMAVPEYEAEIIETEREAPKLMMASAPECEHSDVFADSYHAIPEKLIAVTGDDVYLAWVTETSGCERNIADYLGYLEDNTFILSSDIERIYDATDLWYQYDWNFDLLNAGDADAVEAYYKNGGDFAGMVKRATEYSFKLALLDETGAEMTVEVSAWSIADLVEDCGMTLSTLTAVYEASADEIEVTYPGYEAQAYDLAALHDYAYSPANDTPTPPDVIAPGRNEYAMFRVDAETLK